MYIYINTDEKAEQLASRLKALPPSLYPFDIETDGLDPFKNKILLMQFQIVQTQELYIVNCLKVSKYLQLEILKALWREGEGSLLGHNLKFDLSFLLVNFPSIYFHNVYDTFIAEQILTNGIVLKPPSLEDLSEKYLNEFMNKDIREQFVNWSGGEFSEELLNYSAEDVKKLYPIYLQLNALIRNNNLKFVTDVECRTVPVIAKLEIDGIYINYEKWQQNENIAKSKRREVLLKLEPYAIKLFPPDLNLFNSEISSINWNSPKQLLELLKYYVDNNIKDSNEKTLLQYNHPLINLILEYREYQKLITSYGDSVLKLVNKDTGRLHPKYKQLGAKTGRITCENPNVQQTPKITVKDFNGEVRMIYREAFQSQFENGKMVGADYNAFELRVLADLTQEDEWISGFNNNKDMHSMVASFIFNKPVSKKENSELREIGKTINFGISYGMGPNRLALNMSKILNKDISIKDASKILSRFFIKFPKIKSWQESYVKHSLKEKKIINPYDGRVLSIEGKDFTNKKLVAAVSNEIKNFPCQSTNATVIKIAMINLQKHLFYNKCKAKLCASIHDELLCEAETEEEAKNLKPVLKKIMEDAGKFFIKSIPIVVESYIADYWKKG